MATGKRNKAQTNLFDPIWGDYFAGGAGASSGIACAVVEPAYFAVNHSRSALDMYSQNHPYTRLYCEDVFDVDPVQICDGHPMWLLWASPDCTHHSKARGGKPVSKHIRGLPWAIVRAALKVRPGCIMFENVEEIQSWGPCIQDENGNEYPDPERKGETFHGFISIMTKGIEKYHPAHLECCEFLKISPDSEDGRRLSDGLGYEFEGRELVAADYGAPTIRKRYYGIFRCDGMPIVWPEPTHSKTGTDGKKKWRSAAEIIDWSLPCPSIFESKAEIKAKYGLTAVRPLRPNTLKRVIQGTDKFTIKSGDPFIIQQKFNNQAQNISKPLTTITAVGAHELCRPVVTAFTQTNTSNSVGTSPSEPVNTARTGGGGGQMLILPLMTQYHDSPEFRGQSVIDPIMTIDGSNRYGLATAQLTEFYGNGKALDVFQPMHTITSKDREALTLAHIAEFKGQDKGQSADVPLRTITASAGEFATVYAKVVRYIPGTDMGYWPEIRALLNKYCGYTLADDEVILLHIRGSWYFISDIGLRMLTPRELYNAMGFLPDYRIDFDVNGKPYTKAEKVERCGNAVCPAVSEALVRANFPERCGNKITTMEQLDDAVAV